MLDGERIAAVEPKLRDLRPTDAPVEVLARVVSLERREVTRRSDLQRRVVLSGLLSDGTATVRFTWWDPPAEGVERGTVLRAAGAQVREFRGRPELSFNWKTRVEPASEVELPRLIAGELPLRPLRDLAPMDEGFRVEARVVRSAAKSVMVGAEPRTLHEGLFADGSGTVAFTAWKDFGLRPGEAVRVTGAYVRTFRTRAQLVLDDRSGVERIDGGALPEAEEFLEARSRPIAHWEQTHGGELVQVEGTVVALLPPSGLVYRCPNCRRTISKGVCRVHGTVAGSPDLRARLVLDDGTGALTLHLGRAETETLWGTTLSECLEKLRIEPDPSRLEEALFESVFGRRLRASGRATRDDFGLTLYPERVETVPGDPTGLVGELRTQLDRSGG